MIAGLFEKPWFFPGLTTLLMTLAISLGMNASDQGDPRLMKALAVAALALGFVALAAWFLHAFTRSDAAVADACEALQLASMFRFAYVFSVFAFALLLLPFTAMLRGVDTEPDEGPIRLLRACVVQVQPPSGATSAAALTSPIEICPTDPKFSEEVSHYPWLVAVGGVVARECTHRGVACAAAGTPSRESAPGAAAPGASAASAASAAETGGSSGKAKRTAANYRVYGGFVVPFYVLVFAFVGGVVNLTRRVPEYQKRSSCNFAGTEKEPRVSLLEAREFVIFQIMQFLTAPFIAMVAYYAFEPKGVTTAVVTGFFAGFATESVLLLLRGMFNGLRPETTKPVAAAAAQAQLHVICKDAVGIAVRGVVVELRSLPTGPANLTGKSDAQGEVHFKDVPLGTAWVRATRPPPSPPPTSTPAPPTPPAPAPAPAPATPPTPSPTGPAAGDKIVQMKAGETQSIELIV